jgi:hypothetical protein
MVPVCTVLDNVRGRRVYGKRHAELKVSNFEIFSILLVGLVFGPLLLAIILVIYSLMSAIEFYYS